MINQELFNYIAAALTPFHAVEKTAEMLEKEGFCYLPEGEEWSVEAGKGYYTSRNGSSLIAFRLPQDAPKGFMISAAHSDSPCFKVKDNAILGEKGCLRLSTEKYGGMLAAPWMDRPLGVAGRVTFRADQGLRVKNIDLGVCALIPSVAIHMNRSANENASYNPAVDLLPLYGEGLAPETFRQQVAKAAGVKEEDLLTADLYIYNPQPATQWNNLIAAPRLDDLQCAFGGLKAFLQAGRGEAVQVYGLFDNEEVGSETKQGAASTLLSDTLLRICKGLGIDGAEYRRLLSHSLMISCDNAHALHPNHPEYADKNHTVELNKGIVIKYNANQKYTTDAVSDGLFRLICQEAGVAYQLYANRADLAGGSTLGSIATTRVAVNCIDIGLPQLAMHSCYETAGAADTEALIKALTCFYQKMLMTDGHGGYQWR